MRIDVTQGYIVLFVYIMFHSVRPYHTQENAAERELFNACMYVSSFRRVSVSQFCFFLGVYLTDEFTYMYTLDNIEWLFSSFLSY